MRVEPTAVGVEGAPAAALGLRTVVAAYSVESYAVPRPRGLLGDENLRRLAAQVKGLHSFRFSAAGSESTVFQRLAVELERRTGMAHEPETGERLLRFRRSADPGAGGWEVLARLTPRPLSARAWRVRDVPGALNATIAAAMIRLAAPRPGERYLNLMCGSGTLLAEAPPGLGPVGLDSSREALAAARANTDAALVLGDVRQAPFKAGAFDVLVADLPYGERSGSHATNDRLYREFLAAADRLASQKARLAVISHDIRRFEAALEDAGAWHLELKLRVFQKGYQPAIWLLKPGVRDN
ncbi:MAG TPA: methyltransferase domain-containing protein [Candidatus Dormibacteraeota bacterium]